MIPLHDSHTLQGKARKIFKYVVREVLNHQELSSFRHPHIVEFQEVRLYLSLCDCVEILLIAYLAKFFPIDQGVPNTQVFGYCHGIWRN